MLIVVVFGGVLFFLMLRLMRSNLACGIIKASATITLSAIVGCVAAAFGALIAYGIGTQLPVMWTQYSTELVGHRNSAGAEGRVYLGMSRIDRDECYLFCRKVEGRCVPGTVSASSKVIVFTVLEDENQGGKLVWRESDFTDPWASIVAIRSKTYHYEFHIPNGALQKGYHLE